MNSYGTLTFMPAALDGRPHWAIDAVPHTMMRIKRVFPQVKRTTKGTVLLADTPDVARDLEWFMERYPLDHDAAAAAALKLQVETHRIRQERVDAVLQGRHEPLPLRDPIRPARDYQTEAADLLLSTGRLLCTDEVGLGKSFTALLALRAEDALPALVVTLTALPPQWLEELQKSLPWLTGHMVTSGTPYDPSTRRLAKGVHPDVLVMNYSKLGGWADHLAGQVNTVIFDEAQELRRYGQSPTAPSVKYAGAAQIAAGANYVMGITATPVYNYGGEIFNVLDVIAPGEMGTADEFGQEWCNGNNPRSDPKTRVTDPIGLNSYLQDTGLMVHRTRHQVGRQLPEVIPVPHTIDLDDAKLAALAADSIDLAQMIVAGAGGTKELFKARGDLDWKLRRATGLAKAKYVARFVKLLLESGEKVVLYGWHRDVYEEWDAEFVGHHPLFYTGTESVLQKQWAKSQFVDGDRQLLVMSLRSGAGLDGLQEVCHIAVFGELDWSPGQHDQCTGRLRRDGMGDPVVAYYLVADSGSDPIMAEVLGLKRQQSEPLITGEEGVIRQADGTDRVRRLAEDFLARMQNKPEAKPEPSLATGRQEIMA